MFRLLLPSIVEMTIFVIILILIRVISFSKIKDGYLRKTIRNILWFVFMIFFVGWIIYVINIASVNEIPRSDPDRKAQEQGINNFQEKMQHDAAQPKK